MSASANYIIAHRAVSAAPQKAAAHPAGGIMTVSGHDIMSASANYIIAHRAVSAAPQKAAAHPAGGIMTACGHDIMSWQLFYKRKISS